MNWELEDSQTFILPVEQVDRQGANRWRLREVRWEICWVKRETRCKLKRHQTHLLPSSTSHCRRSQPLHKFRQTWFAECLVFLVQGGLSLVAGLKDFTLLVTFPRMICYLFWYFQVWSLFQHFFSGWSELHWGGGLCCQLQVISLEVDWIY